MHSFHVPPPAFSWGVLLPSPHLSGLTGLPEPPLLPIQHTVSPHSLHYAVGGGAAVGKVSMKRTSPPPSSSSNSPEEWIQPKPKRRKSNDDTKDIDVETLSPGLDLKIEEPRTVPIDMSLRTMPVNITPRAMPVDITPRTVPIDITARTVPKDMTPQKVSVDTTPRTVPMSSPTFIPPIYHQRTSAPGTQSGQQARPRLDIKIHLSRGEPSGSSSSSHHIQSRISSSSSSSSPLPSTSSQIPRPRSESVNSTGSSRHSSLGGTPPPAAAHPSPDPPPKQNLGTIRIQTGPDGRRRTHISWNQQQATMKSPINFMAWFQRIEQFVLQAAEAKKAKEKEEKEGTSTPTTSASPTTNDNSKPKAPDSPSKTDATKSSKPTATASSSASSPPKNSGKDKEKEKEKSSHHSKNQAQGSKASSSKPKTSGGGGGMTIDLTEDDDAAAASKHHRQGKSRQPSSSDRSSSPDIIMTKCDLPTPGTRHPAPLPLMPMGQPANPAMKTLPPKPGLKISRVQQGIVLSWNMTITEIHAKITNYQLFAYQEGNAMPVAALWKKVGDVKALPLPMACTLTQFQIGNKYHFAVRAMDIHKRVGAFSDPCSIHLQ